MGVVDRPDHLRRVDRRRAVERDAELALGAQRLQAVHVVGDGRAIRRLGLKVVVPARPRSPAPRQQPHVGVEHCLVALIRDRAEELALAVGRVLEQRRAPGRNASASTTSSNRSASPPRGRTSTWSGRRVTEATGVDSRSRPVNRAISASTYRLDPPRIVRHCGRSRKPSIPWWSKNSARNRAGKLHIWRGSADHTADAWGTISRSTNARENRWRSSQSPSDGPLRGELRRQQLARGAVEAREVRDHPVKGRRQQMPAVREQAVRRRARVLEVAGRVADAEAHRRRLPRDAETRRAAARSSGSCGR